MESAQQRLNDIYNNDIVWKLLDIYYQQPNVLVKHQLDSFNRFVDTYIPNILAKNFPNITGIGKKTFGPNGDHWERECICNITNLFISNTCFRNYNSSKNLCTSTPSTFKFIAST